MLRIYDLPPSALVSEEQFSSHLSLNAAYQRPISVKAMMLSSDAGMKVLKALSLQWLTVKLHLNKMGEFFGSSIPSVVVNVRADLDFIAHSLHESYLARCPQLTLKCDVNDIRSCSRRTTTLEGSSDQGDWL